MKSKISLLVIALIVFILNVDAQSGNRYPDFKIGEAIKNNLDTWASVSSISKKIEAGKKLVYINWKFYDDYEVSKNYADSLMVLAPDNFDVLFQMADISLQAKHFKEAGHYLKDCFETEINEDQKKSLHLKNAEYVILKSQNYYKTNNTIDKSEAKEVLKNIETYYLNQPEDFYIVRLYLGLALILDDTEKIKDSWKTYFRIPGDKEATGILSEAWMKLDKGLHSDDNKHLLAKGLADSRFYDYAVMVIDKNNIGIAQYSDLTDAYNYYTFLGDIENLIYGYYKDILFKRESDTKYLNSYYSTCIDFWNKLSWENNKPVFYEKAFEEELFKRFGAVINNGKGGDQISFFMGHSVINQKHTIEYYGRTTEITFLSLDYIKGNIFPHWYFGFFGIGGWATSDKEIMQMRQVSFNINSPVLVYERLINEEKKEQWRREIEALSEKDDSLASADPYILLPGIRERMKFNAYSRILDSLKFVAIQENELKVHYLSAIDNIFNATVYNHEARHILDSYEDYPENSKMYSSGEREFRAKLSEIAFSVNPKLVIAETILRYEGGPHEVANLRIVKGLVDWMENNKEEITGLEQNRPLLPQLDLLTNEQIVQAVHSFDPLYAEHTQNY